MSYSKVLEQVGLSIEIVAGVDAKGKEIVRKKNYNGIKKNASADAVGRVTDAIIDCSRYNTTKNTSYQKSVEKIVKNV